MSASETPQNLSPAKRRAFKLLAVVLALLVCFVCLEIGLRALGPTYHRFPTNQGFLYYSNPRGYFDVRGTDGRQVLYGIKVRDTGTPRTRIPDNLWSPEEQDAFLARETKILGLGDSFTFGCSVRYEDTYLRRLEKKLAGEGQPLGVKNAAWLGTDIDEIYRDYAYFSKQRHFPLVIYGFVLNDFGLMYKDQIVGLDYIDYNNGGYAYSPLRANCATINFIRHLAEKIRLDRTTRRAYLDSFKGDNAKRGFKRLRDLKRAIDERGAKLVVVLWPLFYEFEDYPFQQCHDKIRRFCQEEEIPLLDLLPAMSRHNAEDLWVHPMDHHPNEIAHRIAADETHAFLKDQGLLRPLRVAEP